MIAWIAKPLYNKAMSTPYTPDGNKNKIVTPGNVQPPNYAKSDLSRNLPRQMSTGSTRGTQIVGYGNVKIDGSNDRISIEANGTIVNIGDVSDTDNITGVSVIDPTTNQPLAILGRDNSTNSTSGLTIYDSTNTRRMLGGQYPDGNIKIALSQSGFDVATATDDQLIWSSDFNAFKIVLTGEAIITVPNPQGTDFSSQKVVTHNLGYIPSYLVYVSPPASYFDFANIRQLVPFFEYAIFDSANPGNIEGYHINGVGDVGFITETQIAFDLGFVADFGTTPGDWIFKYYLMRETIPAN